MSEGTSRTSDDVCGECTYDNPRCTLDIIKVCDALKGKHTEVINYENTLIDVIRKHQENMRNIASELERIQAVVQALLQYVESARSG